MIFKLKVYDPKFQKQSNSNKIHNHIPIEMSPQDSWNREIDININEKLLLDLIEHITDIMIDSNNEILDYFNHHKIINNISTNDIDKIIKSARAWKSIYSKITNMKLETSKFTRISLFEELLNQKKIEEKIQNILGERSSNKPIINNSVVSKEIEPIENI